MKLSIHLILLFTLIISQAISSIQSELLNNVSHVLNGISDQKSDSTTHAADNSNNNINSNANASPSASPQTQSSSPATPSPAPPPPSSSTSAVSPVTSSKPEPSPVSSTTPSSAEKPQIVSTTPQNSPEPNTDKGSSTHASNNNPSTANTHTSSNDKPVTPNNENTHTSNSPSPAVSSSSSSSPTNLSSASSKSKSNKSSTISEDTTAATDTNVPSATNNVNRSVSASNNSSPSGNKTSVIVGAVVGSIFGIALIGGALTWINRHGGCAKRSNKRSADFDDYGLADTDFPHNYQHQPEMRSPSVQPMNLPGPTAGATVAAAAVGAGGSPTIPRLNDQGTFYGNNAMDTSYNNQMQLVSGYQQDIGNGASPAMTAADYNNNQMPLDYPQQQQAYYYQQSHQNGTMGMTAGNTGYYSEQQGYYYEANHHPPGANYDMPVQYNQHNYADQGTYSTTVNGDQFYKPDQVDINNQRRM